MGVQGGTEERKDWSEAGRAEVSLEGARVKQVSVNEFHGRPKDIPVRTGRKQAEEPARVVSCSGSSACLQEVGGFRYQSLPLH